MYIVPQRKQELSCIHQTSSTYLGHCLLSQRYVIISNSDFLYYWIAISFQNDTERQNINYQTPVLNSEHNTDNATWRLKLMIYNITLQNFLLTKPQQVVKFFYVKMKPKLMHGFMQKKKKTTPKIYERFKKKF